MNQIINNSKDVWLVIDARTANVEISSGISRFVAGITTALAYELNDKIQKNEKLFSNLKILIISKSDPAHWIVQLVYNYPGIVSFWKGESQGFLSSKMQKLTWLWPTQVLKKLEIMTNNRIIWFAPANFDRPLFISNKKMASRVIQVVHDCIPFLKLKGFGFLFKRQFKFLVTRSLLKLPFVATVSQHSSSLLSSIVKKRTNSLYIISDAVDELFGKQTKQFNVKCLVKLRNNFLNSIASSFNFEGIYPQNWVIGVGRNQKYKNWEIALQAIEKLNQTESKRKIIFLRIGADNKEISNYSRKYPFIEFGGIKLFETLNLLFLPTLTDLQLAQLYSISDLLVHPSLAEGFGLPPLEAALSGLPVVYKKGTAVDEHFVEGSLPDNFWSGVDSKHSSDWAMHIERMLDDKKNSDFYKNLQESFSSREFILNYTQSNRTFKWNDSANSLLNMLGGEAGIIENILNKNSNI